MNVLKPEVKKLWVDALRSGDYTQGRHKLCNNGNYCCLGVLCELAVEWGAPDLKRSVGDSTGVTVVNFGGEVNYLPSALEKSLFTHADNEETLRHIKVNINGHNFPLPVHNDRGVSFNDIADAIEEQL